MKDESKKRIIDEFFGLKSKMCSIKGADDKKNKRGKGVYQNVAENTEQKEQVDFLFNKKVVRYNLKKNQSKLHRSSTYDVCNILQSPFDDKRHALDDGISTLAHFHQDRRSQSN